MLQMARTVVEKNWFFEDERIIIDSSKDVFKEKKFFFQINEEFILGLLGHFL